MRTSSFSFGFSLSWLPFSATDYETSLNIRQMGILGSALRDTAFPRKAEENVPASSLARLE